MTPGATHEVIQARKSFFADKRLPVDKVSHTILRSWIRCAEMGLDEQVAPKVEPPTQSEVKLLHERNDTLRRLSRPELDGLFGEARDLSGMVILTNAQGEILDALGDAQFASKAAKVALRPGARWTEDGTGTNGIGTAIAERRAIAVNGPEHYFLSHHGLSCMAAPILDPRGEVMGVLDISMTAQPHSGHMLGLVRLAVEQIEHRLFRSGFEGCQTLRFQTDPNLLGAAREGILVLRDGVVVGANRRGLGLVDRTFGSLDHIRFEDIFAQPWQAQLGEGKLMTQDGREFYTEIEQPLPRDRLNRGLLSHSQAPVTVSKSPKDIAHSGENLSLEAVELALMRSTLDAHKGNVSAAARSLGIHRSTLYRRLGIGEP